MHVAYEPLAASDGSVESKKDLIAGFELKKLAKAGREKNTSQNLLPRSLV